MKVKIKLLNDKALMPRYAKPGDAAVDLTATSKSFEKTEFGRRIITYGTGIALEIPKGHVGLLFPRSSICNKALTLCNSVGILDEQFRGEVMAKFVIDDNSRPQEITTYNVGDRIAQLMIIPIPSIDFELTDVLSETVRGSGGFGHSGK